MATIATSLRRGARLGGGTGAAARTPVGLLAVIERKLGLTSAGLGLIVIALGGFALGRSLENRGMFLAAYGLLFVVGVSWLLGRRKLAAVARRSELPRRVRPGQTIDAELELTASQRISTIVLEEHLHHHLGTPVRVPVPLLTSGNVLTHSYTFTPVLRGVYDVGPTIAEWSDPFGLTRRRQVIAEPETIYVHPRVEPVLDRILSRAWEDPPIRPPDLKPWPTGFEFYGLRDYQLGDDPRLIVWRAVAAHDTYLVRESEQGIVDRVNVVLDTESSQHSPGEVSETFETGVSVLASLARQHLRDGFSVTVHVGDGELVSNLRGGGEVIRLLDQLAQLDRSNTPILSALERLFASGAKGAHTVIVVSTLTPAVARRIRIIAETGASLLVVLCLWDDTDPATIHRAGLLGCNVVEVHADTALGPSFARVTAGRRR